MAELNLACFADGNLTLQIYQLYVAPATQVTLHGVGSSSNLRNDCSSLAAMWPVQRFLQFSRDDGSIMGRRSHNTLANVTEASFTNQPSLVALVTG